MCSDSSVLTSEGEETCDDRAGEADDEQSDWFHDIGDGPTYGIPSKFTAHLSGSTVDCCIHIFWSMGCHINMLLLHIAVYAHTY